MKTLRAAMAILLCAASVAAGATLIYIARFPEVCDLSRWAASRGGGLLTAGLLCVAAAMLWVASFWPSDANAEAIRFTTENGEVCIRMSAVRDYIMKLADRLSGIDPVRCRASLPNNRLAVDILCRVPSGQSAVDIGRRLQEMVRDSLRDDLGIADNAFVRIRVVEFVEPPVGGPSAGRPDAARDSVTIDETPPVS